MSATGIKVNGTQGVQSSSRKSSPGFSPAAGEQVLTGAKPDEGMQAAEQLRAAAAVANPLDAVPASLLPVGQSLWHGSAKVPILPAKKVDATVVRTADGIDIHVSGAATEDISICRDPQIADEVDLKMGGDTLKATIQGQPHGFKVKTSDGKTLQITDTGHGLAVATSGYGLISHAAITLTRA